MKITGSKFYNLNNQLNLTLDVEIDTLNQAREKLTLKAKEILELFGYKDTHITITDWIETPNDEQKGFIVIATFNEV